MSRRRYQAGASGGESPFWITYADMLTGFLLVLLLLIVTEYLINSIQTQKLREIERLLRSFEDDLGRVEALLSEGGTSVEDGRVILDASILFDPGSAELRLGGRQAVRRVGRQLVRALQDVGSDVFAISIDGHADTVMGDLYNLDLSTQRAISVLRELETHVGLDPRKYDVSVAGYGEYRLRVKTGDNVSSQENRRIEIRIVPKFDGLLRFVSGPDQE